jgi:hypothetical protein
MPRAPKGQTLELSQEDNAELMQHCADRENAPKGWLGGVLLRYAMRNIDAAMDELEATARERRRKRQPKA